MATADFDQKMLGMLAKMADYSNPQLARGLYILMGVSVRISRQLIKARSLRRLDTTRDTKSLRLYLRILWSAKEGIRVLEEDVMPRVSIPNIHPDYLVTVSKLFASFYHIICLFNNTPPVSRANVPMYTNAGEMRMAMSKTAFAPSVRSSSRASGASQPSSPAKPGRGDGAHLRQNPFLRDPENSIQSDASFVTNPYANMTPGRMHRPSPPRAVHNFPTPPPGLGGEGVPPVAWIPVNHGVPHPADFLLPARDYIPVARAYFDQAIHYMEYISTNHPLRLSVALEFASFLWDCCHEYDHARRLARRAIREIVQSSEGMNDSDFQDAQALVAALGAIMRRKNNDGEWASRIPGDLVQSPTTPGDNGGGNTDPRVSTHRSSSGSGGSKGSKGSKGKSKKKNGGRDGQKPVRM